MVALRLFFWAGLHIVECGVSVESISHRLFQNLDSVDKKRLHTFAICR